MNSIKRFLKSKGFMFTCLCFGAAVLFAYCGGSSGVLSRKGDAALLQSIEEMERDGIDVEINVIGRCSNYINEEMKNKMRAAGVSLETCTEDLFTASGKKTQLEKLAGLSFVQRLELSQGNKMN